MRWLILAVVASALAGAQERQLTHSARNHALDNNDNFSPDGRYLCFDTRGSGQAILRVDVRTGEESVVFSKGPTVIAASYNPVREEVVFIYGGEPYSKTNRRGAVVGKDGVPRFLDLRDVESKSTTPGAHRGGTHRHEFDPAGKRVGFTYDDQLLPQYGRTIGMLTPVAGRDTYWFSLLVPVVPEAAAKPGDLVMAAGDSWVGTTMRAFIGKVKEADGSFRSSIFVADVPADVDVTTGFAGDSERFPTPPAGVRIRRLTETTAAGIVRGSPDGKWIAFLDEAGHVMVIPSKGGEAKQVAGVSVQGGVRWHPSGKYLAGATKDGVVVIECKTGKTRVLAKAGTAVVWSNDGKMLAFNRKAGEHLQIFVVPFSGDGF